MFPYQDHVSYMFLCIRWQSTIAAMEAALKAGLVGKESWDKVREGGGGGMDGGREMMMKSG
jgi:hypothetical protein